MSGFRFYESRCAYCRKPFMYPVRNATFCSILCRALAALRESYMREERQRDRDTEMAINTLEARARALRSR